MMMVYDLHIKLYNGVKLLLKRKGGGVLRKGITLKIMWGDYNLENVHPWMTGDKNLTVSKSDHILNPDV